jgi:hypothetical protein
LKIAIEDLAECRSVVGGLQQRDHGDHDDELKQGESHQTADGSRK